MSSPQLNAQFNPHLASMKGNKQAEKSPVLSTVPVLYSWSELEDASDVFLKLIQPFSAYGKISYVLLKLRDELFGQDCDKV